MNYYNDIGDLPLYNWIKINEGELKYCRINIMEGSEKNDLKYSDIIKDTNYEEFGLHKDHSRLLELYLNLSECRLDWVISGDNFIKNKIKRLEREIETLFERMQEKGSGDIGETIILMSKWIGHRIDTKITTVKEFRNMISLFKKEIEAKTK